MMGRLTYIDNAKAIGMMLIVASHVIPSGDMSQSVIYKTWDGILNSFYVPLFFLLSGVFEPTDVDDKKLLKRVIKLLKFCAVFYVFGVIMDGIVHNNWILTSFKSQTTIWFLFVLLWITIIVGLIKRLRWHNAIFLIFVSGGVMLAFKHMSLLYFGQACICLPFYLIGYYGKEYIKREKADLRILGGSFIIWLLLFVEFYCPQNLSINLIEQNFITFYIEAVMGSLFVIELCKLFSSCIFCYYGRNSIVPMMVQIPLIWIMMKFVKIESFPVHLVSSLILCVICGLCIPIFRNKYYDIFK